MPVTQVHAIYTDAEIERTWNDRQLIREWWNLEGRAAFVAWMDARGQMTQDDRDLRHGAMIAAIVLAHGDE